MNKLPWLNRFPWALHFRASSCLTLDTKNSYALLYHTFSELSRRYYFNTTTYRKFFNDILELQKHFDFDNDFARPKPRTIYLTFDDSYQSILPVLDFCERNKIPTAVFVNSLILEGARLLPKDKILKIDKKVIIF